MTATGMTAENEAVAPGASAPFTCLGTLDLRVPRLRSGGFFPEDVLTRHRRVDRALAAAAEMYAAGTSARKVERLGGRGVRTVFRA